MKDRNIICKFYQWHGQCEKGKKADLTGYCTHCSLYEKTLINQMSSYFIMQSDENKQKVEQLMENYPDLWLNEAMCELGLNKSDFTDTDYKYLTQTYR